MLIEKTKEFNKGDIVSVLLFTGQEIIAQYVSKNPEEVVLSKVRMPQANAEGQLVGLVPILATADPESENMPFERDKIVCMGATHDGIAAVYKTSIDTSKLIKN